MVDLVGLPPLRQAVCTSATCERCQKQKGGFTFPFLGLWSRRRVIVCSEESSDDVWTAWSQSKANMDTLLCEMYSSGREVADFCPKLWDSTMARTSHALGNANMASLRSMWRSWQLGSLQWMDPACLDVPSRREAYVADRAKAHRAMRCWMASTALGTESALHGACLLCGGPATRYCEYCRQGVCDECQEFDLGCCLQGALDATRSVVVPTTSIVQLVGSALDDPWAAA